MAAASGSSDRRGRHGPPVPGPTGLAESLRDLVAPQREAEGEFPLDRLQVRSHRFEPDAAGSHAALHDGTTPFPDGDVSKVHRRDIVNGSVQFESRPFQFRSKLNREADSGSFDLEDVACTVVADAARVARGAPWNRVPALARRAHLADGVLGTDFPAAQDPRLRYNRHRSADGSDSLKPFGLTF